MGVRLQHIFPVLAAVFITAAAVSCNKDEAEVIPRAQMAEIYAEMLIIDQWISSTPGARTVADTSLVYEPILKKYGYTSEDYRKSIDSYMDDPERFAKILERTGRILDAKLVELREKKAIEDSKANLPKLEMNFRFEEHFPVWSEAVAIRYGDSLDVYMDSASLKFRFTVIERVDSLAAADSLQALDSLKVDSLKFDSLKIGNASMKLLKVDSVSTKLNLEPVKFDTLLKERVRR